MYFFSTVHKFLKYLQGLLNGVSGELEQLLLVSISYESFKANIVKFKELFKAPNRYIIIINGMEIQILEPCN